ncbi:MAG: sulfite exporter TauE/SafE family protein, partial [Lentisphaeria bacterium]|nr:sulfite exporter TauE/SafE family protein [Lentisphaeria bacterium]
AAPEGDPLDWIAVGVIAVVVLATAVRGLLGFGNALIAMPLLALLLPKEVVSPLVAILAMFMASIMLTQTWRHMCFRNAWRLVAGAVFGTPLGLIFLTRVPESIVQGVLAAVIFLFSLYSLTRPRLFHLKTDHGALLAGFVAGMLGGAYNTNGPPVVVYGAMRGWDPERFRATMQAFFWPAGLFILVGHASAGLWTREVFRHLLCCIPVTVVTLLACRPLARRIPTKPFERAVHGMLMATAVVLAAKALR